MIISLSAYAWKSYYADRRVQDVENAAKFLTAQKPEHLSRWWQHDTRLLVRTWLTSLYETGLRVMKIPSFVRVLVARTIVFIASVLHEPLESAELSESFDEQK